MVVSNLVETTGKPDYWRQLGILSPTRLTFPITIIGAGGIGSPTALLLSKMGCSNLTVMDFDTIENHNLPNQFFPLSDINKSKAAALADICFTFSGNTISVLNEQYVNQPLHGVVIAAVDNMQTRHAIWKRTRLNISVPLLIDARMGGHQAQVYALNPCLPNHIEQYERMLYTDEEALEEPCTAQAIMYNTFMIASIIGVFIRAHANREDLPLEGIVKFIDLTTLSLY